VPALVSCIVPVHNGERYLGETLDSIAAQTYGPTEVIVVDDGSTDGSLAIAERHPAGVRCVSQPQGGHASARNRGMAAASGAFVAFLDADDLWAPAKLARQIDAFDARPELGVVFTHLESFLSPDVDVPGADMTEAGRPVPGYSSVCMLARRSVFDAIGVFDVSLAHANDRDWFCRAAEAGVAMAMLPDVLVRRRLHAANRSRRFAAESQAEYLRLLKRTLDRRRQDGAPEIRYPFGSSLRR
jgi:glycosyltransferase involved in cell wall biosynthesis